MDAYIYRGKPDARLIMKDKNIGPLEILDIFAIRDERRGYYERILSGWDDYLSGFAKQKSFLAERKKSLLKKAALDLSKSQTYLMGELNRLLQSRGTVPRTPDAYYGDQLIAWIWTIDHSSRGDFNKVPATNLIQEALRRARDGKLQESNGKINVLEIGPSGGRDFHFLGRKPKEKVNYLGVDYSRVMVQIAKQINSDGNFVRGNVLKLDSVVKEKQAAVFAAAVLHHIHYKDIGNALSQVRKVTQDNGLFFFSVRYGEGPVRDNKTGLDYYRYTYESLGPLLEQRGFGLVGLDYTASPRRIDYMNVMVEALPKSN